MEECFSELLELRKKYGTSLFDWAVKKLYRQRLENADRPKRKKPRIAVIRAVYRRQGGICPECGIEVGFMTGLYHLDHRDPNAVDFNAIANLRIVHPRCNLRKGAKSIYDQAKHKGETVVETLRR